MGVLEPTLAKLIFCLPPGSFAQARLLSGELSHGEERVGMLSKHVHVLETEIVEGPLGVELFEQRRIAVAIAEQPCVADLLGLHEHVAAKQRDTLTSSRTSSKRLPDRRLDTGDRRLELAFGLL